MDSGGELRVCFAAEAPLSVGLVRDAGLAVLVRLSFRADAAGALALSDASAPVERDFVARKAAADLLLGGHAHAPTATARIAARVRVGGVARAFDVVAAAPAMRLPLADDAIREPGGDERVDGVGAQPLPPAEIQLGEMREGAAWDHLFDGSDDQVASPTQRGEPFAADALVELTALSPRAGVRGLKLPGLRPRVLAEIDDEQLEVALRCDTLWIDTDEERVTTVWRGEIAGASGKGREVDLLWVALGKEERAWHGLLTEAWRWTFGFAAERGAVDPAPATELEALMLEAARARALSTAQPRPALSLEDFVAVSAELAEGREGRGAVLARRHLDEQRWSLEEHAWLSRIAADPDGLAARHGELYEEMEDRLARPEEARYGSDLHARGAAALAAGVAWEVMLAGLGITRPAWLRLDRRMRRGMLARARARARHEEG